MDDPILISNCISDEQESNMDFCVFLLRSDVPGIEADHLSTTEEFLEPYKYGFPNNSNISNPISV